MRFFVADRKGEAGFTLIEVLVALTVFSIGILAVMTMQTTSIGGNSKAQYIAEASSWGADRMETLMNLSYTHADLVAGNHAATGNPAGYTVTWLVTDNTPINNTKTIMVTVAHPLLQSGAVFTFIKTSPL